MLGKKVVKKVSYVGKKARTTFSFCLFRVELDRKSNQDFFVEETLMDIILFKV